VDVEFPIGHRRRREEGVPLLYEKFGSSLSMRLPPHRVGTLVALFNDPELLDAMPIPQLMDLLVA
jgi:2-methylcitrate dehydratase